MTHFKEGPVATEPKALMTAGAIAKELGVSDAKVKKAIAELALAPKEKKGSCNYYGPDALKKIQGALK
jgi:predicted transcriptional regulator